MLQLRRHAGFCALAASAILFLSVASGEDYVDIPYNADSVWEFTPRNRLLFSSKRNVFQYSHAHQRVVGSMPIDRTIVGNWIAEPSGLVRAPVNWINFTDNGFDGSMLWARTNRLYHFASDLYLRIRHDGTHSGGDTIRNGWYGIPDDADAVFEISPELAIFVIGEFYTPYCSMADITCNTEFGLGSKRVNTIMPGLPASPSAMIRHSHLGERSDDGLGESTARQRWPNGQFWVLAFKDDQVWAWAGTVGLRIDGEARQDVVCVSTVRSHAELVPPAGGVVYGYPQNVTQFGRCSGLRYIATPVAEIHDGSVSVDGTSDYAYESGLNCRWTIQPPAWMRVNTEFRGFNIYFRVFELRNGTSDYLAVWDTTHSHVSARWNGSSSDPAPVLLYNWTTTTAPTPYQLIAFDSSIQRVTFHFHTEQSAAATAATPARGWQLTYYLQNRHAGTVWNGLYQRVYATLPSGVAGTTASNARTRTIVLQPASQTAVRTEFAFELVTLPDPYVSPFGSNLFHAATGAAACYVEVWEGVTAAAAAVVQLPPIGTPAPPYPAISESAATAVLESPAAVAGLKLVANCSGTDPDAVLSHCVGTYFGAATVRFYSLLQPSQSGVATLLGRTDVTGTCHGTQNSSAYSAALTDGSGAYFYNFGQTCDWLLYPNEPVEQQIAIALQATKADTEVCCDTLSFFDGLTPQSTLRGVFAGQLPLIDVGPPRPVFSSSPYALVRFKSDSSWDGAGVEFNYTRIFRPADTPFSQFSHFRSAFQVLSNGGLLIGARQSATIHIVMRDYLNRPVAPEWGAVRWYVRFIPYSPYSSPAQRLAIANIDVPIHSLSGDPYAGVVESTTASATDTDLTFLAPSIAGQYDAVLLAIMNVQNADATRIVQLYDHSPFPVSVGAQTANGSESFLTSHGAKLHSNDTLRTVAGEPVRLTLFVRDQFGNPVPERLTLGTTGSLRAFAQSTSLPVFALINITAAANATDSYDLVLPISVVGEYTLSVFVNGGDARASPATIVVTPAPIDPRESGLTAAAEASGLAVVSVELSQTVMYELQARDRFQNPVTAADSAAYTSGADSSALLDSLTLRVSVDATRGSADDVSVVTYPYNPMNGTFAFSVRATSKVIAFIHVFVSETEVNRSPFRFEAGASVTRVEYEQAAIWLQSFVTVSALLAATSIGWLLVLNRYFNAPIFRAASPSFLAAMLLASIVAYASAPVLIVYPPTADTCRAGAAMAHLAYWTVWSILCLKLWRVNSIVAAAQKMADVAPKYPDAVLGRYVFAAIAVVGGYILVWFVIDPPLPTHIDSSLQDSTGRFIQFWSCRTTGSAAWSAVLYVAEGCLLMYGVVLSIALRNVSSAYAESKWVSAATYNLVVIGGVFIGLIQSGAIADYAIVLLLEGAGILFVTAITVHLVFLPKFLFVLDPRRFALNALPSRMPRGPSTAPHAAAAAAADLAVSFDTALTRRRVEPAAAGTPIGPVTEMVPPVAATGAGGTGLPAFADVVPRAPSAGIVMTVPLPSTRFTAFAANEQLPDIPSTAAGAMLRAPQPRQQPAQLPESRVDSGLLVSAGAIAISSSPLSITGGDDTIKPPPLRVAIAAITVPASNTTPPQPLATPQSTASTAPAIVQEPLPPLPGLPIH